MDDQNWRVQPYFVLNDEAFDRIVGKLRAGSRCEWSYMSTSCAHHDKSSCKCPRMMNVLDERGELVRIVNGERKRVYSLSALLADKAEPTVQLTDAVKFDLQAEVSPTRLETFIVNDEFGCETCKFCGWMCEFPESHLTHAMQSGCQYIEARFDLAAEMEKQFN